jgi:hypothetical protein
LANPIIQKADVLAFAPEFTALDQGAPDQLDQQLAIYNTMADAVVSDKVWPNKPNGPGNGNDEADIILSSDFPTTGSVQIASGSGINRTITPTINANDDAIAAQDKLETIFGAGNVAAAGSFFPGGLTFQAIAAAKATAFGPLSLVNNSLGIAPPSLGVVQKIIISVLSGDHTFSQGGIVIQSGANQTAFLDSQLNQIQPAAIQAALEGLPGIGAGNVLVVGDFTNALQSVFYVVFLNALQTAQQLPLAIALNTLADSVGDPCLINVLDAAGSVQQIDTGAFHPSPLLGACQLSFRGAVTAQITPAELEQPAFVEAALQALPTIGAGNVHVVIVGPTLVGETIYLFFQNGLAGQKLPQVTAAVNTMTNGTPAAIALTPSTVFNPAGNVTPLNATLRQVQRGFAPMTVVYMAKMLVVCHYLKVSINTEGRISSDRVGDLQSNYAAPDVNVNQDWNNTVYGQRFVQMRRIYAPGLSQSPVPGNFPTLPPVNPTTGP